MRDEEERSLNKMWCAAHKNKRQTKKRNQINFRYKRNENLKEKVLLCNL